MHLAPFFIYFKHFMCAITRFSGLQMLKNARAQIEKSTHKKSAHQKKGGGVKSAEGLPIRMRFFFNQKTHLRAGAWRVARGAWRDGKVHSKV